MLKKLLLLATIGAAVHMPVTAQIYDHQRLKSREAMTHVLLQTIICYEDTAQSYLMMGARDDETVITAMVRTCAPAAVFALQQAPLRLSPRQARYELTALALETYTRILRRGS